MGNEQLTIKEKIERIQGSQSFSELQTGWFPQAASTSYYFVSYCHRDYKKVFIDILKMQQCDEEIAFWYDRELTEGRDWEKEAMTHIYDFDCLGVIFYISENSVESNSIFSEMQMVKASGKPFIPIVLPIENIREKEGKYLSGAELLDILFPRLSKDDDKYKVYHEMFGEKITYSRYFKDVDPTKDKIERMKKSFTRQPLLELDDGTIFGESNGRTVMAINNINAIEANESDYKFLNENNQPVDILRIYKCAFSNCRQLETVAIPKTVGRICELAFYNCKKLKTVKFTGDSELEYIDDGVFFNCKNLVDITLPNGLKEIGNRAFSGCARLPDITIPDKVTRIGNYAFSGCLSLTSITIPNSVTSIGDGAFYECARLTDITIPNSVTRIAKRVFSGCAGLTIIIFEGTVAEWKNTYNCGQKDSLLTKEDFVKKLDRVFDDLKKRLYNDDVDYFEKKTVNVRCKDGITTIKKVF